MKIQLLKNGPILIMVRSDEKEGREVPLALCRCGQSSNKPNCDGTHKYCEFEAEAEEIETK